MAKYEHILKVDVDLGSNISPIWYDMNMNKKNLFEMFGRIWIQKSSISSELEVKLKADDALI